MSSAPSNHSRSHGVGFFNLLGLAFIVLKLTSVIDWDWWLVLLPVYGPFTATILIIFVSALLTSGERK